jgi:hypothetical protein
MRESKGSTPASSLPQKLFAKLRETDGPSEAAEGMIPAVLCLAYMYSWLINGYSPVVEDLLTGSVPEVYGDEVGD